MPWVFFFNLFHFCSVLPDSDYTAILSFETTFLLCLNNLKKKKKIGLGSPKHNDFLMTSQNLLWIENQSGFIAT